MALKNYNQRVSDSVQNLKTRIIIEFDHLLALHHKISRCK